MTNLDALAPLITATRALRTRTGINYATAARKGKFQLQIVTFAGRKSTVDRLSDWLSLAEIVVLVEGIAA